jgi:hypothetical protein
MDDWIGYPTNSTPKSKKKSWNLNSNSAPKIQESWIFNPHLVKSNPIFLLAQQ